MTKVEVEINVCETKLEPIENKIWADLMEGSHSQK